MLSSIITAMILVCGLFQILECQAGSPNNRLNFFDIDLLRTTVEGKKGNVMISPASIKSTLGMILEGATGQTAQEIKSALRVSPERDDYRGEMKVFTKVLEGNSTTVFLQNANALFISNKLKLKKQYELVVQRLYNAEISKLDFNNPKSSAVTVNDWVNKKTHGLIPDIVDEDQITPSTEMMITNALYFKAPWKHGFNSRATYSDCFYNNGVCRNVSMMIVQAELNYAYVDDLRAHAVELPYQDDRYSMFILLPKDKNTEMSQIRDLPFVGLPQIADLMEPVDVALVMPKFDVEYNEDMVLPLKNMNIKTLFSQSANLSGIFEQGEYAHLSSVYHSVHMKVDEIGTIAAAASSSVVVPLINDQVQLLINRPFLFFIRDNRHGIVLFEGKIEEPTEFVDNNPPQGKPQVTKQPLASDNLQQQSISQSNFNPELPKYPIFNTTDQAQTNVNQSVLSQNSFYKGSNQQVNKSNRDNLPIQGSQNQLGSSIVSSGQPQNSPNPTIFNPAIQSYSKVTKAGPNRTNCTSSQVITVTVLQILDCQGGDPINRQSYFDLELLQHSAQGKQGNVMISPASIKSTLAMLLEGAQGQTAAEIKTALRLSPQDNFREQFKLFLKAFEAKSPAVTIQNANALFVSNQLKLKTQYRTVAQRSYLTEIEKLNFHNSKAAADAVNKWVDKKTHGLIPNVIQENDISPSTQLMITNALYFKAPWKNGFNVKKTQSDCFYNNGVCRNVAMMSLVAKLNYGYVRELKSHALELPYQGDRYSMLLLVPQDRTAETTLFRDLPYIGLPQIYELMDRSEVILKMPKFDVEYREDMIEPLRNMHITSLFSQYANLSGIFGAGEFINVNNMFHSVHMKVDEAGTIAAAATTSAVVPLSNDQVRLTIDQPFLFFIRDNNLDVILFEGKIEEPTEFLGTVPPQAQPQIPQGVVNRPITIQELQAVGQTNYAQATLNRPQSNQPDSSWASYSQAVNPPVYYQGALTQETFPNSQDLNNIFRQSSN